MEQMPEEEAFCVLVRMMENYGLRELYKPSMSALALHLFQFEALLEVRSCHINIMHAFAFCVMHFCVVLKLLKKKCCFG